MLKKKIINTIVKMNLKDVNKNPMYEAFKSAVSNKVLEKIQEEKKKVQEDLSTFARIPMTVDHDRDWRRPVVQKYTAAKNIKIGSTMLKRGQEFMAVPSSTALGMIDLVFQTDDGNPDTGEDVFQGTTIKFSTFQKMKDRDLIQIELPEPDEAEIVSNVRSLGERVKVIPSKETTPKLDTSNSGVKHFDGKNKIKKDKNKKEHNLPSALKNKLDEVFRNGSFKNKIKEVIKNKKHDSMNSESSDEVPAVDQKLDKETKKKQRTFDKGLGSSQNKMNEDIIKDLEKIVDTEKSKTIKFKDGKKLKISQWEASSILQVFEKLNDRNQNKMKDTLIKSLEAFNKMLNFALQQ